MEDLRDSALIKAAIEALALAVDACVFVALAAWYYVECLVLTALPDAARTLKDLSGQVALVTGGASGVGRLVALRLARQRCAVVVWDVNADALKTTCDMAKSEGHTIHAYVCDVSDREQVYKVASKVKQEVGPVSLLINNAGIVFGNTILDLPDAAIEATYKVNILSHYWTVKAFLPEMIAAKRGHIVTVGSVAGMMAAYRCIDYSATKAAANMFHECLYTELKTNGHDYINLTLVCPYFINTGMFEGAVPRLHPMLEPEYVADNMIRSIRKNEVQCVMPDSLRIMLPMKSIMPIKVWWDMANRVMRLPQVMTQFKARPIKVAAG